MRLPSGWALRSRVWRLFLAGLVLVVGLLAVTDPAGAGAFLSRKEALEIAFPDAERVERETIVLDEEQSQAVAALARAKLDSRLVTLYTGRRGGEILGYAFIEVHTVRTLPEALLVVLSPDGRVRSLRMVAFYEPGEYLPSERWLEQFDHQTLEPELRLGGRIHAIAGSTLSSRAVTSAVRRSLALYEVLVGRTRAPSTPGRVQPEAGRGSLPSSGR